MTTTTEAASAQHSAVLNMEMPSDFSLYQTESDPPLERWTFTYSTKTNWKSPVPAVIAAADKELTSRGYKRCPTIKSTDGDWSTGTEKIFVSFTGTGLGSGTSMPGYLVVGRNTSLPGCDQ